MPNHYEIQIENNLGQRSKMTVWKDWTDKEPEQIIRLNTDVYYKPSSCVLGYKLRIKEDLMLAEILEVSPNAFQFEDSIVKLIICEYDIPSYWNNLLRDSFNRKGQFVIDSFWQSTSEENFRKLVTFLNTLSPYITCAITPFLSIARNTLLRSLLDEEHKHFA